MGFGLLFVVNATIGAAGLRQIPALASVLRGRGAMLHCRVVIVTIAAGTSGVLALFPGSGCAHALGCDSGGKSGDENEQAQE